MPHWLDVVSQLIIIKKACQQMLAGFFISTFSINQSRIKLCMPAGADTSIRAVLRFKSTYSSATSCFFDQLK